MRELYSSQPFSADSQLGGHQFVWQQIIADQTGFFWDGLLRLSQRDPTEQSQQKNGNQERNGPSQKLFHCSPPMIREHAESGLRGSK